ncbi:hypothetical protein H0H81_003125 [Sphagnurus paluster]|uniref:Pectate lyase n=1 Tax=Sphagnurus paluster TaxID=117069 RepID=A0A9P7FLW5_9AGAR|nr:hypothetical protein H0H81_003125 [Sphagnurus paluster]
MVAERLSSRISSRPPTVISVNSRVDYFLTQNVKGKLYRSCGNCSKSYTRSVVIDNVCLKNGGEAAGINSNFGDTATLTNIKTSGKPTSANVCCTYKGVASGSEPSKIGCGDSFSACNYKASSVGSC